MVLLGELDELALAHIIAKPKPLLAHARADLDTRCLMGLAPLSHGLCLLVLLAAVMSHHLPQPSFDVWGCISMLSLAVD